MRRAALFLAGKVIATFPITDEGVPVLNLATADTEAVRAPVIVEPAGVFFRLSRVSGNNRLIPKAKESDRISFSRVLLNRFAKREFFARQRYISLSLISS